MVTFHTCLTLFFVCSSSKELHDKVGIELKSGELFALTWGDAKFLYTKLLEPSHGIVDISVNFSW